jgi:phosphate transport system protein
LHEIRTRIILLGTLVETALEQAIQAVQSSNLALCGLVIESDRTIDEVRSEVEQLAFQSLTLQQPLAGHNLRFLSSAPAIAGDLERMGDNAAGIAQLLLRMAPPSGVVGRDRDCYKGAGAREGPPRSAW